MGTCLLLTNPFPSSTTINPIPSLSTNATLCFHFRSLQARSHRWDSNAETVRSQSFNFTSPDDGDGDADDDGDFVGFRGRKPKRRRWWSDDSPEDDDDDDDGGVLEEVIDSVWLFKAFRSLGWFLPAVVISFLLATGPKAFLMALAFPLGQSAISLAFKKLWGMTQNNRPKRKSRSKRKPFSSTSTEEEEAESEEPKMGKTGYRSWVVGSDGPVDKGVRDGPGFGGWDDLDRRRETNMGSVRPDRTKSGSQRTPMERGKLSRREREKNTPLFMRLLIAVFPFLGSWIKLL